MTMIKKTTASAALVALTSGLFVNGAAAYSASELESANKLADAGIVVKQSNASDYQLDRQVLRQEIAAVARGLAKVEKTSTCTNMFRDVSSTKPNTWACYTVEALANNGLIAKNANFRPETNITKAEAVGMIVKAAYGNEYNPVAGNGDWQKQVVDFAVSKGIVSQFSNYTTPATRGFVFEVAAKTLGTTSTTSDDDISKILDNIMNDKDSSKTEETKKTENNVQRNEGTLKVELSPESPSNGMVVANSDRAVLLAFTVNAGNTDVTLKKASLKFTGSGDFDIVKNLAIYSDDVKLTKGDKTFNSKLVSDLSFDRNIVVKAGETKTLFVTATIDPTKGGTTSETYNQMIRVALTNLESSATVTGAELSGATLTPYKVSNRGETTVDTTSASGRLYIGQEGVLYNFSVKETNKREDIIVKSVTFEEGTGNEADLDNLSDLVLTANGNPVKATFTYQKSKIVASLNETVKAGQKVNFSLKGKPTDDLNEKLVLKLDNVYSVGATTGIAANSNYGTKVETAKTIEGTAINFTFNRQGTNEVSADTTDVKIGELVFTTTSDYTASIKVTVSGNTTNNSKATYENVELDGDSANTSNSNVYTFTEVSLAKGTTTLPLTIDVTENAADSNKLKFTVEITKLEEETLGEKIDALNRVLNNNSLTKEVTVRTASFKLTAERANTTKVVPKGNQEVVLYKGKIDLTGGENITLENLVFNSTNNKDLIDYISGVTLNIGGKTFMGDVNSNNINFSSIYAEIQGNAKNVNILLTARLKDKELTTVETIEVVPATVSVSAENAKNVKGTITTTNFSGVSTNSSTKVNLVSNTEFEVLPVSNQLKDEVLAGANNAEIGSFKIKETSADIYFNSLKIKANVTGNNTLSSALRNAKLMDGSVEIASAGQMEDGYLVFNDFTLPQSGKDRTIKIVADLAALNTSGGELESFIGTLTFGEIVINTTDATSVGTLNANSEPVKVVPAIVTYSVLERFTTEGGNQAKIKFTVDAGNNDVSRLDLSKLTFNKALNVASLKVNNDVVTPTVDGNSLVLNKEITRLDSFEVVILLNDTTTSGAVIFEKAELNAISNNGVSNSFEAITTSETVGAFQVRQ